LQTLAQRHCWCARAELALARGQAAQALEIVERLDASALRAAGTPAIPRLALLRGRVLIALRRPTEAESVLAAGESAAAVYPARSLLWRIRAVRGRLAQAMERRQEAARLFSAAREVVDEIAASLSVGAVRERFLREAGTQIPPPR
jgi:ATP/maltotriose-dependent transcriptional regulator MalT